MPHHIGIVSNRERNLGDLLSAELATADAFSAASAFLNRRGLDIIKDPLERILQNEGRVDIVHGADFRITDPDAIRTLVLMAQGYGAMNYALHCHWNLAVQHFFHPKLYLTTSDYQNYCAIVGSSNLTFGGMRENEEVNVVIRGDIADEAVGKCLDIFDSISSDPMLIRPNLEFVEHYEILHRRVQSLPMTDVPPPDLQRLYQELMGLQDEVLSDLDRWQPKTQREFVVKALQNLTSRRNRPGQLQDAGESYFHLSDIYIESERIARAANASYRWDTWKNSVRGRINDNVAERSETKRYFRRREGLNTGSGEYCLTHAGRIYRGKQG